MCRTLAAAEGPSCDEAWCIEVPECKFCFRPEKLRHELKRGTESNGGLGDGKRRLFILPTDLSVVDETRDRCGCYEKIYEYIYVFVHKPLEKPKQDEFINFDVMDTNIAFMEQLLDFACETTEFICDDGTTIGGSYPEEPRFEPLFDEFMLEQNRIFMSCIAIGFKCG